MPSHNQVAAAVRRSKEAKPELYCRWRSCLWRLSKSEIENGIDQCPRHRNPDPRRST